MARRGRHPRPMESILRIPFLQNWNHLSDPGIEEVLDEVTRMCTFARLPLLNRLIAYQTAILNFRRLIEEDCVAPIFVDRANANLRRKCLPRKLGLLVDITLVASPNSTKNASGKRDPATHQTMKREQLQCGMRTHS